MDIEIVRQHIKNSRRLVVMHHAFNLQNACDCLKPGDVLFLDDCLYSQHVWLQENISKLASIDVLCVLGLSPCLVRPKHVGAWFDVASYTLHDAINSSMHASEKQLSGFMSADELLADSKMQNVYVALHGCMHIDLHRFDAFFEKVKEFKREVLHGIEMYKSIFNEQPLMYVYPYAYEIPGAASFLRRCGFQMQFAGNGAKRIPIENLCNAN